MMLQTNMTMMTLGIVKIDVCGVGGFSFFSHSFYITIYKYNFFSLLNIGPFAFHLTTFGFMYIPYNFDICSFLNVTLYRQSEAKNKNFYKGVMKINRESRQY